MVDIVVSVDKNEEGLDAHPTESGYDTHPTKLELQVEAENDERLKNFVVDEDALGRSFYLQTFVGYGTVLFSVKNILNRSGMLGINDLLFSKFFRFFPSKSKGKK